MPENDVDSKTEIILKKHRIAASSIPRRREVKVAFQKYGLTRGYVVFDRETGELLFRDTYLYPTGDILPSTSSKFQPLRSMLERADDLDVVTWERYKHRHHRLQILECGVPLYTSYHSLEPRITGRDEGSYHVQWEVRIDDFIKALRDHFVLRSSQDVVGEDQRQDQNSMAE